MLSLNFFAPLDTLFYNVIIIVYCITFRLFFGFMGNNDGTNTNIDWSDLDIYRFGENGRVAEELCFLIRIGMLYIILRPYYHVLKLLCVLTVYTCCRITFYLLSLYQVKLSIRCKSCATASTGIGWKRTWCGANKSANVCSTTDPASA